MSVCLLVVVAAAAAVLWNRTGAVDAIKHFKCNWFRYTNDFVPVHKRRDIMLIRTEPTREVQGTTYNIYLFLIYTNH